MFSRKRSTQPDPARAVVELRARLDQAIDDARSAGARGYQIIEELENAARRLRIWHAARTAIQ
jgi:hypothetical protein